MQESEKCRICSSATNLQWSSNIEQDLTSDSFAITDAHYGQTSAIYKCSSCGFLQCHDLPDVLSYYEQLEDLAYEQGRKERLLQAEAVLKHLKRYRSHGRLLDVGAGSGILVEKALESGFQAEGVEPSIWLQEHAAKLNLPVRRGVLNDLPTGELFDIITLIDVIEHVVDPVGLMREIGSHLRPDGYAVVVTPDCSSFFAKLLGRRWWHYRVAHIGYFNKSTLSQACLNAGFEVVNVERPCWYFTTDYLWVRIMKYFPRWLRLRPMNWMNKITIPINLRDSLLLIVKHKEPTVHGSR
jgi:2-polyprenyl-3-methyl-5-hydroxy-6-metoxy-1,4-benzoquinol methylase